MQPRHYPHRLAQPFVHQKVVACVLVSKSSLTALVTLGLGGSSGLVTKCPNGVRRSIELASLTYLKGMGETPGLLCWILVKAEQLLARTYELKSCHFL